MSEEQNGFVKGRFIGNNIRLMFDFIDYMDYFEKPGTLLSLDMHKAFDSLRWDFIFEVFQSFGFGNNFICWLKTVYNVPKCCIVNNNYLSPFFEISKGVRQGDPLSPTIFIVCMQCLSNMLEQDKTFQGVVVSQEKIKFTMFADDILLFLSGTTEQFARIFDILNDFAIHSHCKLNLAKCQAFHVGSNRCSHDKPYLLEGLLLATRSV